MNAYTTIGPARIQQHDIERILRTDRFLAAASLAALERTRGYQADAEVARLLRQHAVESPARTSLVSLLRQTIGTILVHAGEGLMGVPECGSSPETADGAGMLSMAD